jgi:hypothetical protein
MRIARGNGERKMNQNNTRFGQNSQAQNTSAQASAPNKNLPEKKFRAGPIAATIWNNQSLDNEGKVVSYRTVSFERSYKDKNNTWQTTTSLRVNDLPKASLVLEKAFEYLALAGNTGEEANI